MKRERATKRNANIDLDDLTQKRTKTKKRPSQIATVFSFIRFIYSKKMNYVKQRLIVVFIVGWVSYGFTYFLRKPLGVVKL